MNDQKPPTAKQCSDRIKQIIKDYDKIVKSKPLTGKLLALIEDVKHLDLINLYNSLEYPKQLYMAKDLDCDRLTIVFMPRSRCVIQIESEPVLTIKADVKLFSAN